MEKNRIPSLEEKATRKMRRRKKPRGQKRNNNVAQNGKQTRAQLEVASF